MSIDPMDYHKKKFMTPWDTFNYVFIPFGLSNVMVAFQRVMTFIFFDLLHNSMLVFIDDSNIQTTKALHFSMLCKCFIWCRQNSLTPQPHQSILGYLTTWLLTKVKNNEFVIWLLSYFLQRKRLIRYLVTWLFNYLPTWKKRNLLLCYFATWLLGHLPNCHQGKSLFGYLVT